MVAYTPPPVDFQGAHWSSRDLTRLALVWRNALGKAFGASSSPIAMVLDNHPEAVALFFALSSVPAPLILLPPEAQEWRSAPPIPSETRLVMPPRLQQLTAGAELVGLRTTVLPDPGSTSSAPDGAPFLTSPGIVLFTSGSTDQPRPVYRRTTALLGVVRSLMATLGLPRGGGVIATLPLARSFGLSHGLVAATVLESPLALLDHFDHHAVLRLFDSGRYQYWAGTPMMAAALGRGAAAGGHGAPLTCVIGGRLSSDVFRRFKERIGVPPRQFYGTTETGGVSVDAGASAEVRHDAAGRPLPGVELRIGDDPRAPLPSGTLGRIWLSNPRYIMDGYGFPPDLKPLESVDGWWPTPDVGLLDETGYLTVAGRLDDCLRTEAGRLVNPARVAAALEDYPGVTEVAVVPLSTAMGPVIGVMLESTETVPVAELRRHLARSLPMWAQPRVINDCRALPRLSSGRVDRRACIEILERMLTGGEA